jgi:uncharacterized membrane protein (DUF485 family)
MTEYYQCSECGKIGTEEEMMGHHHSWDWLSFGVGVILSFFIMTTIGRRMVKKIIEKVDMSVREKIEKRL